MVKVKGIYFDSYSYKVLIGVFITKESKVYYDFEKELLVLKKLDNKTCVPINAFKDEESLKEIQKSFKKYNFQKAFDFFEKISNSKLFVYEVDSLTEVK